MRYLVALVCLLLLSPFVLANLSASPVPAMRGRVGHGLVEATQSIAPVTAPATTISATAPTTTTTATVGTEAPAPPSTTTTTDVEVQSQGNLGTHTAAGQATVQPTSSPAAAVEPVIEVPTSTLVANMKGAAPGSPAPGAPSTETVPGTWYGYPSELPVIATQPQWLEVRLAQRPNESTAWIPQSDATLSTIPYAVVVNLGSRHLTVYQSGQPILSFPAGIGTPTSPTTTGSFFIAMVTPAPDPGFGPFVLVTSAHSDSITDWENSGDAIIAIHGPIDARDDSLIGTTGAAVSNGCVRLHDSDLAHLANLPPGTPVIIVPG